MLSTATVCAMLALNLGAAVLEGKGAAPEGDAWWPTWRGPDGTGVARSPAPASWSDGENVRWKVPIEGRGMSTPVVWGDLLFLTTAVPTGRDVADGRGREEHEFVVLAIDRQGGGTVWRRSVRTAVPHEGFHRTYGSFASSSAIADAERVWASFGSFGLYCLDHEGKLLWQKDPGVRMEMRGQFGEGASPGIHGDVLVQAFDHEGDSFVVALDKRTGEELWRRSRDEPSVWAPPLFVEHDGRTQVVLSGVNRVRAYDLATGEPIWECGGLGTNPIPMPVQVGDRVVVMSGHRDPNILAVRLGGKGDLTGTDHVVWQSSKGPSYTASPVLWEGRLYCVMDRGFISCFEAATGEPHYVETRLPRGSTLKASPIAAGGRLYVATEEGDVHLVGLGKEYQHLGTNSLEDQVFIASPVAVEGDLFLRSLTHLWCIGDASAER